MLSYNYNIEIGLCFLYIFDTFTLRYQTNSLKMSQMKNSKLDYFCDIFYRRALSIKNTD